MLPPVQARIKYINRQYNLALRYYQDILKTNPSFLPDPRIGIGLCYLKLGHPDKAKYAWERSIKVVS